jgi:hypothetical protein
LASASSDILTNTPFGVTPFWDRTPRYPGKVSVWYPYHPLYGVRDLSVVREFGCGDVQYVELATQKRQAVPAWMLDQERCAQMTCGLQPTVDLAALLELADWLQARGL